MPNDRCSICGRKMLPAGAGPPNDPRINTGGHCLGCVQAIEREDEPPAQRPMESNLAYEERLALWRRSSWD